MARKRKRFGLHGSQIDPRLNARPMRKVNVGVFAGAFVDLVRYGRL